MTDVHTITDGPERGRALRIVAGQVETRTRPTDRWSAAPLRHLARAYAVGEGPWPWLREHGVRRPSPSGKSGPSGRTPTDAERGSKPVRLADTTISLADKLAMRWGCTRGEAIASAVLRCVDKPIGRPAR